jgi:hypothetical protein
MLMSSDIVESALCTRVTGRRGIFFPVRRWDESSWVFLCEDKKKKKGKMEYIRTRHVVPRAGAWEDGRAGKRNDGAPKHSGLQTENKYGELQMHSINIEVKIMQCAS